MEAVKWRFVKMNTIHEMHFRAIVFLTIVIHSHD